MDGGVGEWLDACLAGFRCMDEWMQGLLRLYGWREFPSNHLPERSFSCKLKFVCSFRQYKQSSTCNLLI